MLASFLIMLREGVEAALIVGIVASYLARTGRRHRLPAVWAGVVLAALCCLAAGIGLDLLGADFPQREQEMFEAGTAVIAVIILTSMVLWMKTMARSLKAGLQDRVDRVAGKDASAWPLIVMVFLAVGREGLESVVFLLAIFGQGLRADGGIGMMPAFGAVLGLAAAVAVGFAIHGGGVRLDLRRFFQVSGVLIIFVAAGLLAGAVNAAHEAGLWNGLQATAYDASGVLPETGIAGTLLAALFGYREAPSLGEVIAWLVYLIPALAAFLVTRPARPQAASLSTRA